MHVFSVHLPSTRMEGVSGVYFQSAGCCWPSAAVQRPLSRSPCSTHERRGQAVLIAGTSLTRSGLCLTNTTQDTGRTRADPGMYLCVQ